MPLKENVLSQEYFKDFSGGVNYYLGPRQVKDNESPDAINCDFKGKSGVGNRDGYAAIGPVTTFQIDACDSLTADGEWVAGSNCDNLAVQTTYKKEGTKAIYWEMAEGKFLSDLGNLTYTAKDLSAYEDTGYFRMWYYLGAAGATSNQVALYWGTDLINCWYNIVVTDYQGAAIHTGWNLLKFDWATATKTGSPISNAIVMFYVRCDPRPSAPAGSFMVIDDIEYSSYDGGGYGITEYHTSSKDQLVKFISNNTNIYLSYSDDLATWTDETGTAFTDNKDVDVVQAAIMSSTPTPGTPVSSDGVLFTFNGTDAMQKFDGSTVSAHTGGTKGLYGAYFDRRLWCVDETYKDTLNFSTKTYDATKTLDFTANGTSSNPGTLTFEPGAGKEITGLIVYKNALYVFLNDSIYRLITTSTVNEFTVTLITNAVGCISHRSICQVGEDIFFAADDGVYSLGDIAYYTEVRTTNKSARIQQIFDGLSAANKKKLVGIYHKFKYHLYYSLFGTSNDSCMVYDTRYQAWQDWRSLAANNATLLTDSDGERRMFFIQPTDGKVNEMYSGTTDDGVLIESHYLTKSFDSGIPDVLKLYMDSTFIFGSLNGSVTLKVIFNDSEISTSKSLSQVQPQGGLGTDALGVKSLGEATNTITTITSVINTPIRFKAKGKKFAIQYYIYSQSGSWRLDEIGQALIPFSRFKFPSTNKI